MKTFVLLLALLLNYSSAELDQNPAPEILINVNQDVSSNEQKGPSELTNQVPTKSVPKVIIDTDAGLDDAEAIFMTLAAHKRGDLEVVAITTVIGNTGVVNVTNNVLRILETAQLLEEIPVYNGSWTPLERPWSWEMVDIPPSPEPYWGWNGFGDVDLPPGPEDGFVQEQPAEEALVELVNQYERSIVLIAIGPLTNLAKARQMDPQFVARLAGLYTMGGNTREIITPTVPPINIGECGAFNLYVDPEGAQVIFESTIYTETKIHLTPSGFGHYGVNISNDYHEELRSLDTPEAHLLNQIEANCTDLPCGPWVTYDQLASAWMIDNIVNEGNLVPKTGEYYATIQLEDLCRGHMVIDHDNPMHIPHNLIIMEKMQGDMYKTFLRQAYGATE